MLKVRKCLCFFWGIPGDEIHSAMALCLGCVLCASHIMAKSLRHAVLVRRELNRWVRYPEVKSFNRVFG